MNVFATYYGMARSMVGHAAEGWSKPRGTGASSALLDASKNQVTSVFETLDTTAEGLTESEVHSRLEVHGHNTVAHERATPWPRMLLNNFRNPFILVLSVLVAVSYATGDPRGHRRRVGDGARQRRDAVPSGVPLLACRGSLARDGAYDRDGDASVCPRCEHGAFGQRQT